MWWPTQIEHYRIPGQRFVISESQARTVTRSQLGKVRDAHVRMSLELQQAFGLHLEGTMMIQPGFAVPGDYLVLKASWTTGGRECTVPIRTDEQREVLNRSKFSKWRNMEG